MTIAVLPASAPSRLAPIVFASAIFMLISKSPSALAAFARDPRWRPARDKGVHAWSDDYTNILGALVD